MNDTVRSWIFGLTLFVALVTLALYISGENNDHLFPFDVILIPAIISFVVAAVIVEIPPVGRLLAPEYAAARRNHDYAQRKGPYYNPSRA